MCIRDRGKGKITGIGKIDISSLASTNNVLYVEAIKYNLPSISQFCCIGYIVSFNKDQCIVKTEDDNLHRQTTQQYV